MNGVGDMPPSMSQSLTGDMPACMTQSMQVTPSPAMSDRPPDIMTTSTSSLNFKTGKKSVPNRSKFFYRILATLLIYEEKHLNFIWNDNALICKIALWSFLFPAYLICYFWIFSSLLFVKKKSYCIN